jgi:hypothetical protein
MSRVFVSHSHEDKAIARRIARYLRAYGVDAWLDERELRLGSRLDDAIRIAIQKCDAVVVVATQAAALSQWVEREVAFASGSSPAIAVCPVYVDDVIAHPSFAPNLGIDARDRYQFGDVLARLAEALIKRPLPQPDMAQLKAGLDELSLQSSAVALLVESCLHGEGLRYEHVQLISELSFHDLDDALDVISRVGGGSIAAHATAALFAKTGAGSGALSRYIVAGHNILDNAVGTALDSTMLDAAIRLLSVPKLRDDQALASFLWKNSESLAGKYRAEVVHLVTHPSRGPAGFGADAAAAAFGVFPEDDDLQILWSRWIREELFDGQDKQGAARPQAFAHWCAQGLQTGSGGWSRVFDSFIGHVRQLARTKSKQAVHSALQHMMSAANESNPRLAEIVRECRAAIGAAEWDGWEERDEISGYVSELTAEAFGERRWGEAMRRATENWEAVIALRRAISNGDDSDAN